MDPAAASRRFVPAALAALFGFAVVAYGAIWVYYIHSESPRAFLGITYHFDPGRRCISVEEVRDGTPAATAGLKPSDCIVAVNGQWLPTPVPFYDAVARGQPGDGLQLTVQKEGASANVDVALTVREPEEPLRPPTAVLWEVVALYPVPFMLVGLAVLALRPSARDAWLLALLFAGFGVGPLEQEPVIHPWLRGYAAAFNQLMSGLFPALFYIFLAVFPASSPLDRRLPWIKWLLIGLAVPFWAVFAALIFAGGTSWAAWPIVALVGRQSFARGVATYHYVLLALGVLSLAMNCYRPPTSEAGRKARLIAWSFAVGYLPWLAIQTYAVSQGRSPLDLPFLVWAPTVVMLMLLPVLFAYAVIRHRVLEFSVLVRRSARYLLVQRGFVVLSVIVSVGVTLAFAVYGARWLPRLTEAVLPAGIALGALFGLVLMLAGGAVARRVTPRIDRAFFRSAYDAQQILEDLAEQAVATSTREELAALLEGPLRDALQPARLVVYLRTRDNRLTRFSDSGQESPPWLDPNLEVVQAAAREGRPWDVSDPDLAGAVAASPLGALAPDCLVPIRRRGGSLVGLLVLGPRLSDEPYSRGDRKLLASVAGQAGVALENVALAEEMADRLEAERRAAREVEIAAEVQRRLLPQSRRSLRHGEYDGRCMQAKVIGGDYFDFIDLAGDQLGLVLADVSGKGLYAALLMANLHAQLRSLSGKASESLPAWLESVNRAFFESTSHNHYATLFVGAYDDESRRLRYVNCGHVPPVLLRTSGALERLEVTAGAVGLFEQWSCNVGEASLAPGDLLVVASDGVTEAISESGEEFGDARVVDTIRRSSGQPVARLIDSIILAVQRFTGGQPTDDVTLAVLRAR